MSESPPALERPLGRRCCIHVGLPKTATTMLQKHLFPGHPQIEYLGSHVHRRKQTLGKWRDDVAGRIITEIGKTRVLQADLKRCRQQYLDVIAPAFDAGRVPLWSAETLSLGKPHLRMARAENFHAVFGRPVVIITIRHPLRLVESIYLQHLKRACIGSRSPGLGRKPPYFSVNRWLQRNLPAGGAPALDHLDYAHTIDTFAAVLGKDSVGVLVFEQLAEDPDAFVRCLCRMIGVDPDQGAALVAGKRENGRWTATQTARLRQVRGSVWKSLAFRFATKATRRRMLGVPPKGVAPNGPRAHVEIPDRWRRTILDQTREGNRRLAHEWNLPLQRYGYPL